MKSHNSRYVWGLATLVAFKVAVLTILSFQWKTILTEYVESDENWLIAIFAAFFAFENLFILFLQLTLSSQILDRLGIRFPLCFFPIVLAIIALSAIYFHELPFLLICLSFAKMTNVFRRSVHDPALAIAYGIIDPKIQRETIVFVTGMIKPFAEVATGVLLILVAPMLASHYFSIIWLILCIPWLVVSVGVSRSYLERATPFHDTSPRFELTD